MSKIGEIMDEVYAVICDRKAHPKEGSYTNYLFSKWLDKMCKKIGEESSEVIIAAKNDSRSELVYEISDLIYHIEVIMVNKGITLDEIHDELRNRR